MHITIEGLFEVNAVLGRGLNGVDPYTGVRVEAIKELPPGIFRHLRRLHRAVKDELELIAPDHKAFVEKWAKDGKMPAKDAENFGEYFNAYQEFFYEVVVIPFATPFKLDILEELKIVLPVDVQVVMENVNDAIESEKTTEPPATADTDKQGAVTPEPNA
jgi:hypothetical protein